MKLNKKIFALLVIISVGITLCFNITNTADSVFQTKCSKCHALRNPDNYSRAEWKYNVERMAKRAGLTPQEIKEVIDLNKK